MRGHIVRAGRDGAQRSRPPPCCELVVGSSRTDIRIMIALVTGSSGFIGSHLVDALTTRGATVRVLSRADATTREPDPRTTRWTVDLLDDRSVRETPAWEGVTHVFHL